MIATVLVLVVILLIAIAIANSHPKTDGGKLVMSNPPIATPAPSSNVKYHYRCKDFFMSKVENDFFDALMEVVGNNYYVFPQVHLSTILDHTVKGQSWKGAYATINQKSVDYVICSKGYRKPLLAIELDDGTHDLEDRQQRDANVAHIFEDARLPLVRFRNVQALSKEEITRRILEKLPTS
jgi:hypothetical protein